MPLAVLRVTEGDRSTQQKVTIILCLEKAAACLPRHPAVAYLFLVRPLHHAHVQRIPLEETFFCEMIFVSPVFSSNLAVKRTVAPPQPRNVTSSFSKRRRGLSQRMGVTYSFLTSPATSAVRLFVLNSEKLSPVRW